MGRYSGEDGGPLTASSRAWRRTMSPGIGSGPRRGRTPGPPRDRSKARLLRLYEALRRRHGPQRWWPGRSPYEIAVGAVLTQHTTWINAARAIAALRARRRLTSERLAALGVTPPPGLLPSAGTHRGKTRPLQALPPRIPERPDGRLPGRRA